MNKNILIMLIVLSFTLNFSYADVNYYKKHHQKRPQRQEKQIDKMLIERLNLSNEQVDALKANKNKRKKEMEALFTKMHKIHDEIRDVYLSGIPKYQADIVTAPKKARLVILKQNIKTIQNERRKEFLNILNDKQKAEFQIMREEMRLKKHRK